MVKLVSITYGSYGSYEKARGLGVAFFATGPGWVLKFISFWHSNLPYFKKHLTIRITYSLAISPYSTRAMRGIIVVKYTKTDQGVLTEV